VKFIKVRKIGEKRFAFLTPKGGETRLRIHAAMIPPEKVEEELAKLRRENPEFEFKAVGR
jgi:hypothetical protein